MNKTHNRGFTIIELLIATAIFSIILLVLSAAIVQIGRMYYKGMLSSRTQETARSVLADITQAIQFSPGSVTSGANFLCADTRRYSYAPGQQRTGTQHALVVDEIAGSCPGAQSLGGPLTASSLELLGEKQRVSKLNVALVAGSTNSYAVSVRIVYGDDDLLCSPGVANSCTPTGSLTSDQLKRDDLTCKTFRSGSQFCAVSELSTIVERRLLK